MNYYSALLENNPPLSRAEETVLLQNMHAGCMRSRERVILGCVRYAAEQAARYTVKDPDPSRFQDALNAAMLGVTIAADKFDPEYVGKIRFIGYAKIWVKNKLMLWANRETATVRLPQHLWQDRCTPRPRLCAMDAPLNDSGTTAHDLLANSMVEMPAECIEVEWLATLLECLTDRQKQIVSRRFGVECERETLDAIAATHGVSSERIRQIEAEALGRMKKRALELQLALN